MLVETNKIYFTMCSSRKYVHEYFPWEGTLSKNPSPPDPPPARKFELSYMNFFKFFGLMEPHNPHPPPGNPNPCGGVGEYGYFLELHSNIQLIT